MRPYIILVRSIPKKEKKEIVVKLIHLRQREGLRILKRYVIKNISCTTTTGREDTRGPKYNPKTKNEGLHHTTFSITLNKSNPYTNSHVYGHTYYSGSTGQGCQILHMHRQLNREN